MKKSRLCSVSGCEKEVKAKSYCQSHYARLLRHGNPLAGNRPPSPLSSSCEEVGCENKIHAKGLCNTHYRRKLKHGTTKYEDIKYIPCERWIEENKLYDGSDCIVWPFYRSSTGRGMALWKGKRMTAPRAMCYAVCGDPDHDLMEAAHSCGNGHLGCMNPRHLRWASHMENVEERALHGRDRRGEEINTAKLTESDVRTIRSMNSSLSSNGIAKMYGVTKSTIVKVRNRSTWAWLD